MPESNNEPSAFKCPDPVVGGILGRIEFSVGELNRHVATIAKEVREANHRTTKIESEILKLETVATEREKWAKERTELLSRTADERAALIKEQLDAESKRRDDALEAESEKRDKKDQNQKWFVGTVITIAAVSAGIVNTVVRLIWP